MKKMLILLLILLFLVGCGAKQESHTTSEVTNDTPDISYLSIYSENVIQYDGNEEVYNQLSKAFKEDEKLGYYLNLTFDEPMVESDNLVGDYCPILSKVISITAQVQDRGTFNIWQNMLGEWCYSYALVYHYDFTYTKDNTVRDAEIEFNNSFGKGTGQNLFRIKDDDSHYDVIRLKANHQSYSLRIKDNQIMTADNSEPLVFCKDLESKILYYWNEYNDHYLSCDEGFADKAIAIIEEYGDKKTVAIDHYQFEGNSYADEICPIVLTLNKDFSFDCPIADLYERGYWKFENQVLSLLNKSDHELYEFDFDGTSIKPRESNNGKFLGIEENDGLNLKIVLVGE